MLIDDDTECPRPDCPLRLIDESSRAQVVALPAAVREAITRTWCHNPRILDGSLCAESLLWWLANHGARGKRDSSQEERVHVAPLPRTARGPRRGTGAGAPGGQSA